MAKKLKFLQFLGQPWSSASLAPRTCRHKQNMDQTRWILPPPPPQLNGRLKGWMRFGSICRFLNRNFRKKNVLIRPIAEAQRILGIPIHVSRKKNFRGRGGEYRQRPKMVLFWSKNSHYEGENGNSFRKMKAQYCFFFV